jgi:hypothetical protein
MWICSPSLIRLIALSSRIEKATLQPSSTHTHFTLMPLREVNVLLSDRTMQTWDSLFLENLARDGILLYARGSLPAPLAA